MPPFPAIFALAANMNGRYSVSSGGRHDVPFNDDYASRGLEYFDVWSPEIATHYAEVFWTDMGTHPIPPEIVRRFANKTMAIVGYEMDQMERVSVDPNDVSSHGAATRMVARHRAGAAASPDGAPSSQWFSEGNGGESRKSFHGYPAGFAQLVRSPRAWHTTPMQIDIRNRDCGATPDDVARCSGPHGFTPGPEPRQARYGLAVAGLVPGGPKGGVPGATNYSGLLECPCNGRYGGDPAFYPDGGKGGSRTRAHVLSAEACFGAVAQLGVNATSIRNETAQTASSHPLGCSSTRLVDARGASSATFNTAHSAVSCEAGARRVGQVTSLVGVTLGIALDAASDAATLTLSGPAGGWFGAGLHALVMADQPYTIVVAGEEEAQHCAGTRLAASVTVLSDSVSGGVRTVEMSRPLKGRTDDHYSFSLAANTTLNLITAAHHHATLTLTDAAGAPTCVCDQGGRGDLCHDGGTGCAHFVKECAPPRHDAAGAHYPFGDLLEQRNPTCSSMSYAGGLRCCGHGRIMLDADQPVRPELLRYHHKYRFWFEEYLPAPRAHAAVQAPAAPSGGGASHLNLERIYYMTEASAGEYDVPPAFATPSVPLPGYPSWPLGVPTPGTSCTGSCPTPEQPSRFGADCECVHTITYHWSIDNKSLIYAGGHCHAPSCLDISLYRNDTGTPQLLCRQATKYGAGDVKHDKFDEADFVALPPCLWEGEGLDPAPWLGPKTPMVSVKRNRNTRLGHFGEMASWQMRGVPFPAHRAQLADRKAAVVARS
ncbi:hypothetical protein EMIHUDRAFT_453585 [Emiliania huxleyi CCMP1516]|uniref:Uncharacterized protein n=2 Tax=Emiliania huxleyi TaxID=2903 RepID=A0A0D3I3Z4_EMIH1|nr:hypothetical protein EMIHUDRAFT_453585 [Emiliania huxleyi CCMP1516]EOD05979.1 hypothetical protein EMIHUDRAFT_453585 [Emiliania huxleyi CCMP1516]|eukprot:XP_005758408.1 hypothetical protein EMIHUDRAFT_453585 [Emiliania huxleyi CCMP1516]